MNTLFAVGNLGGDAETRYTQSGKAVTGFSVAITSGWGDRKKTTWVQCILWGRDSEPHGLTPYLNKGKQIAFQGEVFLEEWQAQDGSKQKTLKCTVRDLSLMGSGEKQDDPGAGRTTDQQDHGKPVNEADFDEDDIPF